MKHKVILLSLTLFFAVLFVTPTYAHKTPGAQLNLSMETSTAGNDTPAPYSTATTAVSIPYEEWPVIATIEQVGNNAHETVEFVLNDCTNLRIYAVGEQKLSNEMVDFGAIENITTGQIIWQMYEFETQTAGNFYVNRLVDRAISLPAGRYRLHFQTNGDYSYNDWGYTKPDPAFWGITLYEDLSSDNQTAACWTIATNPEALGWSTKVLDKITSELETMDYSAVFIATDGQVVFDWGNTANNFFAHSIRKSLFSGLYGIYVNEGKIDLSKTLAELGIDDRPTKLTEEEKQATLADLLKARSGVYIPAAGEAQSMKEERPERGSHSANSFWYYNNWDFNVLGTIFDQESGEENIYQAFQKRIASQIDMQDFTIENLKYSYELQLSQHPYYGFHMSARDLARFGQLYLQEGAWRGTQLIPPEWIEESTQPHSRTGQGGTFSGYGYMWWVAARNARGIPKGSFAASGGVGQAVEVLPNLNTVMVFLFNTDDPALTVNNSLNHDQLVLKFLEANRNTFDPVIRWTSIWVTLTAVSLLFSVIMMVRTKGLPWGLNLGWLLIVFVFGPVGLGIYLLSNLSLPSDLSRMTNWRQTLNLTVFSVTGNAIGFILIIAFYIIFLPEQSADLNTLLVPALIGWFFFRAPLTTMITDDNYFSSLRRTILLELISSSLVIGTMLPIAISLFHLWFPRDVELTSSIFWSVISIAAHSSTIVAFPFNLWLVLKCVSRWPDTSPISERTNLTTSLTFGNGWRPLLLSLAFLVISLGFAIGRLN